MAFFRKLSYHTRVWIWFLFLSHDTWNVEKKSHSVTLKSDKCVIEFSATKGEKSQINKLKFNYEYILNSISESQLVFANFIVSIWNQITWIEMFLESAIFPVYQITVKNHLKPHYDDDVNCNEGQEWDVSEIGFYIYRGGWLTLNLTEHVRNFQFYLKHVRNSTPQIKLNSFQIFCTRLRIHGMKAKQATQLDWNESIALASSANCEWTRTTYDERRNEDAN